MSVETLIEDCERGLVQLIRLGLLARYPTQSSLAALASLQAAVLHDALCFVTGEGLFEWRPYSVTAADGVNVILPSTLPAGKTNGRWHRIVTSWTYGAGGLNLGNKTTGYLQAVEAYSSDDGPEKILERLFGRAPSVLVQFVGDDPAAQSNLPGTFYKGPLDFELTIVTSNLRGGATASQGSPISSEAPGAYRIIGDLRRLLCGVSPEFGIDGVERVEIGASELDFEDEERRLLHHVMQVKVLASFDIEDEDLVAARVRAQPAFTEHFPAARFDKQNYVAVGGRLDEGEGPGFSRTVITTVAVVGGLSTSAGDEAVTYPADSDTYRDISSSGVWSFVSVDAGQEVSAPAPGLLRVAVTRTDSTGVVSDRALCSFSIPFGEPIEVGG